MLKLTKSDVVMIYVISDFYELFPILGISVPNFCHRFNVPSNDSSSFKLLKISIKHLLKRKIIFCKNENKILNFLTNDDFKLPSTFVGLTKYGGKIWESIFNVNWNNCWMNKSFDLHYENNSVILINIYFNIDHLNHFKKFVIDTNYSELITLSEDEKNIFPLWDNQKSKEAYLCGAKIDRLDQHREFYKAMPKLNWKKNINDVLNEWGQINEFKV